MDVVDWIFTIGVLAAIPLYALVEWACDKISKRVADRRYEMDELREQLQAIIEERDGWKETAESTHKLLQAEHERADRLAAMNQGLAEDLAALKAYNPEEVEEQLRKIREIKANEERVKQEEKIKQLIDMCVLNAQLNILAGTPVQTATQTMWDRMSAAQYGVLGR